MVAILAPGTAVAQDARVGAGDVPDGGASDGNAGADAVRADLDPPELLTFVSADYPPDALEARAEGTVVLRLRIDAEGGVIDAEVMQSAGRGFDAAAQAAALRFRFQPAMRAGIPVPARILYRYSFRLPVGPPEMPVDAGPAGSHDSPPSPVPAAVAEAPLEVTVRGLSDADRRRQSAEAVAVVETDVAKRESADMGEVLARTKGVGVQRAGGLGSETRFSLNGLTGDQVRFFVDGVPLELAGYLFGIANVPVNLVGRMEIYSGVVPVRFGADALAGAVNLVTDDDLRGRRVAASYQVGSFDTHRLTLSGRYQHARTGLFARARLFLDYARNNYPVDVEVPDERGRLSPARIYRFHDAYHAGGANVEVGFVDRPWVRRLLLRGFVTNYDKQYQHNIVMTIPYGGVTYGETTAGVSLRYEQEFDHGLSVSAVGGYAYTRGAFLDVANCVYDWFGRCVRDRPRPGETGERPYDQVTWDHSAFARLNAGWQLRPTHALRLAVAPTLVTRTGDERRQVNPDAPDALAAERQLLTAVAGLEYQLDLWDGRLENIAFAKGYLQLLRSEEPRPGDLFRRRDRDTHRFGVGEALRFRLTPWLYTKASYEWATRLPRPEEIFGDNAFVVANLELQPEVSHNLNLELTVNARGTRSGTWRATANGFLRLAENFIVVLGDRVQSYQNVFGARSVGAEAAVGWLSRGEHLALDVNGTYVDLRNTSSQGTFGDFAGDRLANRPYLFGTASGRLQSGHLFAPGDELSVKWTTRYVHAYFRGWESVGLLASKQVTPGQVVHSVTVGYRVEVDRRNVSTTLEVQNVTDERVFDVFGVQRPGRAFYAKVTAQF